LVHSVEPDRCGYDLHCTRGKEEIHVEVKGTRGDGRSVLLTAAELERGFSDERFVFAIVATPCTAPVATYWPAKKFRQAFAFEAIQFRARLKGREEDAPNTAAQPDGYARLAAPTLCGSLVGCGEDNIDVDPGTG
jgi:hypothetical protein